MLSSKQIKIIEESNIVALGSVDNNGQPRIIYVMPSKIENTRIVISNIQMNKTIENIKNNKNVFINYYASDRELQIKINGVASIENNTPEFFDIKNFEESNNLSSNLKVKSIIIVNIKSVEETIG